jgi:hypothetical protein
MAVFFAAHDLLSFSHAMYDAILPGEGGIHNLLSYAKLGIVTDRWFARRIPVNTRLEGAYFYLNTYLLVLMGKWFGSGFPKPEFLDISDIRRILYWISEKGREGKACCITTVASNAARIGRLAWDTGMSLEGTKFIVSGEPFTKFKRETLERVGASATPRYAFSAGVQVGYGCGNPVHTDEIHINKHILAVIPLPKPVTGNGTLQSLLFTTLHPSAPVFYFNVENGDCATLEKRKCGCAFEMVGLTQHLYGIRSYEKFTSEGMNYFYSDLFELLEKTIPSEFGGGPGDYQLVEEEDDTGQTRLTLLVDPGVGDLNEENLISRLQQGLAQGSRSNRFMSKVWQDAGAFRIRRAIPHASARGKILPLHIRQKN